MSYDYISCMVIEDDRVAWEEGESSDTHTQREREMGQLNKSGCAIILYDGYIYQCAFLYTHIYIMSGSYMCIILYNVYADVGIYLKVRMVMFGPRGS